LGMFIRNFRFFLKLAQTTGRLLIIAKLINV
jgi:hypothetical protein